MTKLLNKVIFISKKKTSMRLAVAEWDAIDAICQRENIKRNDLIEKINEHKNIQLGLTCSVRLFTIIYFHHLLLDKQRNYVSSTNPIYSPIFAAIRGIL